MFSDPSSVVQSVSYEGKLSLFATIPHSGTKIPLEAEWLKSLPLSILMEDVDAWTDKLYGPVLEEFQIPFFVFEWHRYSLDINRFVEDISEETVKGATSFLDSSYNKVGGKNYRAKKRIKSPSDIHWRKSTKGHILMKEPISLPLHNQMIKKYFEPFHQKIRDQFDKFKQAGNKKIYLLDLHSMPSVGLSFHKDPGEQRVDIVLGDNNGQATEKPFTDLVLSACRQAGFNTALNQPYRGGAITQSYGQPKTGQNALQLELNRKLYMDENTKQRSAHFNQTQDQFRKVMSFIIQYLKR